MANYTKTNIGSEARVELHDTLGLTGAEVSVNQLPAGAGVPFVHAHQQNEEIYGILAGKGKAVIDGEEIALTARHGGAVHLRCDRMDGACSVTVDGERVDARREDGCLTFDLPMGSRAVVRA